MSTSTSVIDSIATVAVFVGDQDRALDFWTRQVGFDKRRDEPMDEHGRWIEVGPAGSDSALVICPRAMRPDWAERKPMVVFRCTDVELAHRTLSARGVTFDRPPQRTTWGTFASFLDTEGNQFGLSG
jgi:lactoylglutathione lyase